MNNSKVPAEPHIESLSAVTLATSNMAVAVHFYSTLGFVLKSGGPNDTFTSFSLGATSLTSLNLAVTTHRPATNWWGRLIFYVSDVDSLYRKALDEGLNPEFPPRDGAWGERYFHIHDMDGHELSFAKPLSRKRHDP